MAKNIQESLDDTVRLSLPSTSEAALILVQKENIYVKYVLIDAPEKHVGVAHDHVSGGCPVGLDRCLLSCLSYVFSILRTRCFNSKMMIAHNVFIHLHG